MKTLDLKRCQLITQLYAVQQEVIRWRRTLDEGVHYCQTRGFGSIPEKLGESSAIKGEMIRCDAAEREIGALLEILTIHLREDLGRLPPKGL